LRLENCRPVEDAQLDRIDPELLGELVHRGLQREHARGVAGTAHEPRRGDVQARDAMHDAAVGRLVDDAGGGADLVDVVHQPGGVHGDVVLDPGQPAVGVGGELDALDRGRAVGDQREHVRAQQRDLDRAVHDLGGHRGEHRGRAGQCLGAEATADVLGVHPDLVHLEPEQPRERDGDVERSLVGVVEGQPVVFPDGKRRVGLHWVVVLDRGRVGLLHQSGGGRERGADVAGLVDPRHARVGHLRDRDLGVVDGEEHVVGLLVVADVDQPRGLARGLQRGGDDAGDHLPAVLDLR
jgi:hypothetical protein